MSCHSLFNDILLYVFAVVNYKKRIFFRNFGVFLIIPHFAASMF
nr:MAG TPA: hypothetical protein [Caudoviricetes sp.]